MRRKRVSQSSTELDNAKAQVASSERKIKRQDALISELEAQLERGSAHAPGGDDESASDESDDDSVDPASQLGGWDPDYVKQVYEHMLRGRRRFKALVGVGRDDYHTTDGRVGSSRCQTPPASPTSPNH